MSHIVLVSYISLRRLGNPTRVDVYVAHARCTWHLFHQTTCVLLLVTHDEETACSFHGWSIVTKGLIHTYSYPVHGHSLLLLEDYIHADKKMAQRRAQVCENAKIEMPAIRIDDHIIVTTSDTLYHILSSHYGTTLTYDYLTMLIVSVS